MGNNSLSNTEKSLRSIAKRYENVKYSVGLAVLFLMNGTSAFSDTNTVQEIDRQKEVAKDNQAGKTIVKETKKEKKQASQKLKASWVNMQFGANDMYSNYFAAPKAKVEKTSVVKSEKTVLVASADNTASLPMFAKLLTDIEETTENRTEVLTTIANKEAVPTETATPTMEEIKASKQELRSSVGNLQDKIDTARRENQKEINGLRLELIQLMEQGNQVVKSPWSSWQFGANYFYEDWGGAYKGRGDKSKKYPFEGIFTRESGENEFNRYVAENSQMYKYLTKGRDLKSASTSLRGKTNGYGLASNTTIPENPVSFTVTASIKPRIVTKGAINVTPPEEISPALPKAIDFKPVTPMVTTPTAPTVTVSNPLDLSFNGTGFGQGYTPSTSQYGLYVENYHEYNTTAPIYLTYTATGRTMTGGTVQVKLNDGTAGTSLVPGTSSSQGVYFINDAADHSVTIKGDYDITRASDAGNGTLYFVSLNPYEVGHNSSTDAVYDFAGNLTLHGHNNPSSSNLLLGFEHQLLANDGGGYSHYTNVENGTVTSVLKNTGTITLADGYNLVGIQIDTEYGAGSNGYFRKQPQTINDGKIIINSKNSIGIDYGNYYSASPNTKLTLGNIEVNGENNYGFRMKSYYNMKDGNTTTTYYDLTDITGGGSGKKISVKGKNNVGISIAQGYSTGDPLTKVTGLNVEVGGTNNVGFLRNSQNALPAANINTNAMVLNSTTIGDTFNFDSTATGSALIRSDVHEVILDKDITVGATGVKNALMQAGHDGKVTLASGKKITSTIANEFYGMTAGNFTGAADGKNAIATNKGELNIGGNKSLGMAIDVDDTGFNIAKINFSGTEGAGVYNTGTFTSDTASEINVTGNNSIGAYNKGTLTTKGKIETTAEKTTGIFSEAGTVTNTGIIDVSGKSVKAIAGKGTTTITSTGKVTVNGTALSDTDGSVGLASMDGANITQTNSDTNIIVDGSASIGAYADGGAGSLTTTKLTVNGGTVTAKGGAFNIYAGNKATVALNGANLNTEKKSLAFYTTNGGKVDFGTGSTKTVATIKGGTDSNSRGTAFLFKASGAGYSTFDKTAIGTWAANNFTNLNNLKLVMEQGSRLFIAQNVAMDLSGTNPSNLLTALPAGLVTGSNDYKTFMLYLSKLTLDQNINLDDLTDAYNKLEISNSTIENQNSKTITGTTANQVAIAQENDTTLDRTKVQLINKGTINLSGANSTAIYGKFAEITNDTTGTISVADGSAALYGTTDSKVENKGTISLGSNSVGIFSKGDTAAGYTVGTNTYKGSVVNSGTITSTGKATGITYNGTGSGTTDTRVTNDTAGKINLAGEGSVGIYGLGSNYHILNKGEITLGDSSNISTNPNVGIYTAVESIAIENNVTGKITTGKESVGTYGYDITSAGKIITGDNGVAIYSKRKSTGPSTVTNTGDITVGSHDATAIFLENGGNLNLTSGTLNIGANSYGVVAIGNDSFNYNNNAAVNVNLGEGATYFYSSNPTTNFTNNIALNSSNKRVYGISTPGTVINSANFTLGDESVGILYTGTGTARNTANITVGNSDVANNNYAIGMATKTGTIENVAGGTITVGSSGIGLFADGANARAINNGTINLNGPGAMGMYLDNQAIGTNNGTIQVNGSQEGAIGVVVQNRAKLVNYGNIIIDGKDAYAFFKAKGGIIENHNTIGIQLTGGAKETYDPTSKPTSKTTGSVVINAPAGATPATTSITVAGVPQTIEQVVVNTPQGKTGPAPTSLGIYVDTLGGTNPISGNLGLVTTEADLILGNEAAKTTTSKNIIVSGSVLDPYNAMMAANPGVTWSAYAGALTWTATPLYANGDLGSVVLAKIPYTEFAGNEATPVAVTDTYNFLNGLEQRYGVEAVGTREKALFDKLNEIGKNEKALFYQATDEMMGHQYANVQQRVVATGDILDKEFNYLRNEWSNPSKDSNKIKTFGTNGEYKTSTAGVIDYTNNAYGVAYVHEDETVRLGESTGWYAGIVHNTFRFKDIGNSKEEMLQGKIGIFKSVPFDHNNSLNWTISGDIFAGYNKMNRRFLVVDEVFNAKGRYHTYGLGLKNEVSKEFRLSESFTLKPYAALGLEYGRVSKIREKSGEIKLDVKSNDYFSVRPEVGAELGFKHHFDRKTVRVGVTVAYENELGRVANGKNKAKVAGTDADYFNIRGEKEDRRGNVKTDLNIGVDNQRIGVTANIGYDTKGNNVRAGVGLRVIF